VAKTLGVTFVDPNCWVDDWDFARDGLHVNRRGARELGQLYSRVCGISGGGKKMSEWLYQAARISSEGTRMTTAQEHSTMV
jgi:hypothetical protein